MLPQLALLADTRGVLRLAGEELIPFLQVGQQAGLRPASIFEFPQGLTAALNLQGLLTNDVKQMEAQDATMQYAAILNSHGRYLHDLFLHRQKGLAWKN